MAHRSLGNLLEIRHVAVDEATTALAEAIAREEAAIAGEIMATDAILAEVSAASAAGTDDAAIDALAKWLPRARRRQHDARSQRLSAEAATGQFRAALAAAQTAEATVMSMIKRRQNKESAERRKAQENSLLDYILIQSKRGE